MRFIVTFLLACFLSACSQVSQEPPLRIAINPWPGYEFLYLASKLDLYSQQGLNIEILESASLADAQRAYQYGRADGFTSTMIEAVQAAVASDEPLSIVMVPDYSNGGDVILAPKSISSMQDLRGKKIGCEIGSLGMFILQQALAQANVDPAEVDFLNVEQLKGEQAMLNGEIDAYVTYPPVSAQLLRHNQFHQIFDSSMIPGQVIDTLSIRQSVLEKHPELIEKLHIVWDQALEYRQKNPQKAYQIMALREGISSEEFVDALEGLQLMDSQNQFKQFSTGTKLEDNMQQACKVLYQAGTLGGNCDTLDKLVLNGFR